MAMSERERQKRLKIVRKRMKKDKKTRDRSRNADAPSTATSDQLTSARDVQSQSASNFSNPPSGSSTEFLDRLEKTTLILNNSRSEGEYIWKKEIISRVSNHGRAGSSMGLFIKIFSGIGLLTVGASFLDYGFSYKGLFIAIVTLTPLLLCLMIRKLLRTRRRVRIYDARAASWEAFIGANKEFWIDQLNEAHKQDADKWTSPTVRKCRRDIKQILSDRYETIRDEIT